MNADCINAEGTEDVNIIENATSMMLAIAAHALVASVVIAL
jgi:hypothetical protein